jgi:hypothetical protein
MTRVRVTDIYLGLGSESNIAENFVNLDLTGQS